VLSAGDAKSVAYLNQTPRFAANVPRMGLHVQHRNEVVDTMITLNRPAMLKSV
jgi:hypothetical protein